MRRRWPSGPAGSSTAGWRAEGRPSGGLTLLRLTPEEVRPDDGRQLGFWGGEAAADSRAARALARVQGMLGPEAVVTAVPAGGRAPAEQVRLVPWGDERGRARRASAGARRAPGAGRAPRGASLAGPAGGAVAGGGPPAAPAGRGAGRGRNAGGRERARGDQRPTGLGDLRRGSTLTVTGWAGPWPVEERWWDAGGRRKARLQVVLEDGTAHLLGREGGCWWVEAAYE